MVFLFNVVKVLKICSELRSNNKITISVYILIVNMLSFAFVY